jgi:hypothetical protein
MGKKERERESESILYYECCINLIHPNTIYMMISLLVIDIEPTTMGSELRTKIKSFSHLFAESYGGGREIIYLGMRCNILCHCAVGNKLRED